MKKKSIAILTAGIGAGSAQTFILREYVDKVYGKIPGLEGLGGFGTYSAMGGLIAGGITTGLGLVSVLTGKITTNETIQLGLIGYGIPALSGGALSGIFPVPATLRAPAGQLKVPAQQITLKSAGINPGHPAGRMQNLKKAPVNRASQVVAQTGSIPLRT